MATVAGRANRDVLDRSGQSTARIVLHVADCTLPRGSLEDLVQMAGFTAHRLMRAAQLKSSTRMVENGTRLLRMGAADAKHHQQHTGSPASGCAHNPLQTLHASSA